METAGTHTVTRVARAMPAQAVADVLDGLRGRPLDYAGRVYVLDGQDRLLGEVELTALLAARLNHAVAEVMSPPVATVAPTTDQEMAASVAVRHGLEALPVVDDAGRLMGVLPPAALMAVLRAEHIEDLHRLSGVVRDKQMALEAIQGPPLRRARHRLPWLLIGLAGSALATIIMAGFEATLAATVAVAFFVPGIVYLADAIGTQTEAAAVRGLSFADEPLRRLVWGELRTGLVMGATLAAVALPGAWLMFGDLRLAAAVATTVLSAGAVATTIGLLLPWALARLGSDPAHGAGPLATVIQDVLSILIYLSIATVAVR